MSAKQRVILLQLASMWFRGVLVGTPEEIQSLGWRAFQSVSKAVQVRIVRAAQ